MNTLSQIVVPFHNTELSLVEHNGQPYVPMRSIVQGMGLDWKSQFSKLKQKFATCVVEITMQILGDTQARLHTCLLLRKLPAWLYSIHASKVKPEIRETVIKYQNECDDVLWDYWTKGVAVNSRSTKKERESLIDAVHLLVEKAKHLNFSEAYKLVHQRFNVKTINEIPYDAMPIAVEYVHHLIAIFTNSKHNMNTVGLAHSMLWCRQWWREYGDAIRKISPHIAYSVHDHFIDGAFTAWMFIDESEKPALHQRLQARNWIGGM